MRILSGPLSHPVGHGSLGEAGTRPRHASAHGGLGKNFLSFALALFALGIWCIISVDPVPDSFCSLRLGVAEEFGKLDFSGSLSVGAILGSTVDTCSASVLWWLWTNCTHFFVAADSNLPVLLSLLLQNG